MSVDLEPDDQELVRLARSLLGASGQAAAARDGSGKIHVGVAVDLPHFQLEALQSVVASVVTSGATSIQSVAVIGWSPTPEGVGAIRDLNAECPVWLVDSSGIATGRA
jgi:hypothetical protein